MYTVELTEFDLATTIELNKKASQGMDAAQRVSRLEYTRLSRLKVPSCLGYYETSLRTLCMWVMYLSKNYSNYDIDISKHEFSFNLGGFP